MAVSLCKPAAELPLRKKAALACEAKDDGRRRLARRKENPSPSFLIRNQVSGKPPLTIMGVYRFFLFAHARLVWVKITTVSVKVRLFE